MVNKQPINKVVWVNRDKLKPNNYNPNFVAPPELELLKISILEDGWTQPIVADKNYVIIDGFHRWTVSDDKRLRKLTNGQVPVVFTNPKDKASQQMATIRHNRARGTHAVLNMSKIVGGMIKDGVSIDEISKRLKMDNEEVIRLSIKEGVPETDVIKDAEWSKSWVVNNQLKQD